MITIENLRDAHKSWYAIALAILLFSCSASKKAFNPDRKYSPEQLKNDYILFRNILEESHPSLYWFTPRDSMDYYFDIGYKRITDSMPERDFRTLLSYVISKVRCGHTSVKYSKRYSSYLDTARIKLFPLTFKFWKDTMAVVSNFNRKDSLLKRGSLVKRVNGFTNIKLVDTLFEYLNADAFAINGKYQFLSNRGNFGAMYRNVFGLPDQISIGFVDSLGIERNVRVPMFVPARDSTDRDSLRISRRERKYIRQRTILAARNMQIDTSLSSAYMTLNTFSRGNGLRAFFRRGFRILENQNIQHLVVDVRGNGGGDASLSSMLTSYLINAKFKIADSLYAVTRSSRYGKHIQMHSIYWLLMQFITRKQKDGNYHFGFFERHYFNPRRKHHFDRNVYIITGGNSFSATSLFAKALKGQPNVTLIGEETGGGAYGNSAWIIPDVTLPNTKIRFRLPKFRLVMDKKLVKEGRGVIPDIEVCPTVESIRKGIDLKIEKVKEIIRENNNHQAQQ